MLYAAVGVLPRDGSEIIELAIAEARKAPGVVNVISYPGLICDQTRVARPEVAVVTRGFWLARQSLERLMVQCGGIAGIPTTRPLAEAGTCESRVTRGTAQFVEGHLRLWVATADVERSRALAARLAGVAEDWVDLRVLGNAEAEAPADVLTAAIALARELHPAPVQVILAPVLNVPLLARSTPDVEAAAAQEEGQASGADVAMAA